MRQLELQPGDYFCVKGSGFISGAINFFQKIYAKDNESIYSHAGLILDSDGTTMEAIPSGTLGTQNFFEAYKGNKVLIVRYDKLTPELHEKAIAALREEFEGEGYPYYRIFLHMIPVFAKFHFLGRGVCSEVVNYYRWQVGARHEHWAGSNPDTCADEGIRWKDHSVIFQGTL